MKTSFLSMLLAALALSASNIFAATAEQPATVAAEESSVELIQIARRGADDADTTPDDNGGGDLGDGCDDAGTDIVCG